MKMIRQAVIMAGGLGSRLGSMTKDMPKGFIDVGGMPIIEQSVRKLIASGIEEIIIGTGHCSDHFNALAEKYGCITLVKNENYSKTGSMGTLACCAPYVKGDFLLLESDLLYDSIGLFVLINDEHCNVILASGKTGSGDEVYLESKDGFLQAHSKDKGRLKNISGELTGLNKLTKETLDKMVRYMNDEISSQPRMEYEVAMSYVSSHCDPIFIRKVEHYVWCEIDDENHLKRAKETIYAHVRENEDIRSVRREVLLNPGPATTTDSVKYSQIQADVCPRENEFGDVMGWVSEQLSSFVGEKGTVETVLFGGSGMAGDEAMMTSCIPDDGKVLIVENGAYGARLARIADIYGIKNEVFESDGVHRLDVDAIKSRIASGEFTHFAIIYHETTTGLLNPVPELCRFCHEHDVVTIVDAVSAFAAIPIDMNRDCIDFMASTSNKNIQGMAGVAFVFCRREALERIKGYRMRNYYLNIYDQYQYFKKNNQTRFTPPVQTIYALRQAIIETKVETIEGRYQRYTECWKVLTEAIERMGLKMPVDKKEQSHLIVTIEDPASPKYKFDDLHDLARKYSFTIYPGKLTNASTFRIANIGDIRPEEMKRFTEILEGYVNTL